MPPPPKTKPRPGKVSLPTNRSGIKKRHLKKRPTTTEVAKRDKTRNLSRHADRIYVFNGDEEENSLLGHAAILSFEFFDIQSWKEDCKQLAQGFKSIKCSVINLYMESANFNTALGRFLDKRFRRPRIIFISCHGGETPDGLELSSGSGASMLWSNLVKIVGAAEVDVLTMVNCCHAGAAYMPQLGAGRTYAKELIVFGGWNELTYGGKITGPICRAMGKWFRNASESKLTGEKLYQYISAAFRHERDTSIKKYRNMINDFRKTFDYKTIANYEQEIEWTKKYYSQPIYTKRYVDWEAELVSGLSLSEKEARSWKLSRPVPKPNEEKQNEEKQSVGGKEKKIKKK